MHGVSAARVAVAWVLAKANVTSVIVGVRNIGQLEDNLAAVDLALSLKEIAKLDDVSALPGEYPGWMVAMHGAGRVPQPFKPKD